MTEGEDSVRPRRTQVSADYSSVVLPAQTNGCVIGMFIFSKPRSLPIYHQNGHGTILRNGEGEKK
jgi:hypothetical protein